MNKTHILTVCGLLLVGSLTGSALGAGFQLNEHGAAGTGRAGAAIATVNDASAVYHNVAGLTRLKGVQLIVGVSGISPMGRYRGKGFEALNPSGEEVTATARQQIVPVPHLYATYQVTDRAYVGIGIYNHYGLGIRWPNQDKWIGRTVLRRLRLQALFTTPSVAIKLSDHVSVGVGLNMVPATLLIKRSLGATDNGQLLFPADVYGAEGTMTLSASAFGMGGLLGVTVDWEDFKFGLSYKSAVDLKFSGRVDFNIPTSVPASIRENFPDQAGRGDLTIPHTFGLGVGWEPGDLSLELAVQITAFNSYDELRVRFDEKLPSADAVSPRDWKVTPMFRLGGAYQLDKLAIRAGVAYDVSPAPASTVDPTMPDATRAIGSLGLGYDFGAVQVDASYMGMYMIEREVTAADQPQTFAPGFYGGGLTQIFALDVGAKF